MQLLEPSGIPLVRVRRGFLVESVHAVAACASTPEGEVTLALGDIDVPVYLRSSAKPFIAGAIVASGAAREFGLEAREIAVIAASHNGEPFHVEAVRSILRKIRRSPSDLQCGAHAPYYEPAAEALAAASEPFTALHNNCSGKHAGILALCAALGADHATYLERSNPAQQAILAFCARLTGDDPERFPVAVDGCGIPVFATPLRRAARAFARWATLRGLDDSDAEALARVREAVVAHPEYLAGTGRFDTQLVAASGGGVVGKVGAEGVHCDALVALGLGLALKVIDGGRRAVAPATFALLDRLGALDEAAATALAAFARTPIRNVAGRVVGEIETG